MTEKPSQEPKAAPNEAEAFRAATEKIVIRDKRKVGMPTSAGSAPNPTGTAPVPAATPETAASTEKPGTAAESTAPASGAAASEASAPGQEAAATDQAAATSPAAEPEVVDGELVEVGPAEDVPVEVHPQAEAEADSAEVGELRSTLDERTADLQRVSAEYANYRKRVDRDRAQASESAVGMVLASLLPVLDDVDRAREHGDLTGPFASVAEQLMTVVSKFGLTAFGAKGDAFDPKLHEAVAHLTSAEVTEPTCVEVMRRGYLLGERLLRPAMVAVADPDE